MARCCASVLLVLLVFVPAEPSARQPPPETSTDTAVLEAALSLTDQELAYDGVDRRAGRVLRGGEIFGWHDGSIRIAGMLDIAGGCAEPRTISAALTGRKVRLYIEQAALCPAVFTPHRFYARVSGLRSGRYQVEIVAPRGLQEPGWRNDVEVPPLRARQ